MQLIKLLFDLAKCNCNWNCGGWEAECTHSDCEPTRAGCGFLWLGSCDKRDEIFPGECP